MSTATEYTGTTSGMRQSPWLASEDLDGLGEIEVTIEKVIEHRNVKMEGGRIEPVFHALKFTKGNKQMILNAVNRKRMAELFTTDTKKWPGKSIRIYVKDGIRKPKTKDETCKGIRIK